MILPNFDYFAPETIQDVCALLKEKGAGASVLAGGTDLMPKMKHGLQKPTSIVSLKNLKQLQEIKNGSNGEVIVGAGATHNDLVFSELLAAKYPSIGTAARQMAANPIRHRGTVGGNCCSAVPSADLPPIFIALGANVKIVGSAGERIISLEEFFVGPGKTVLAADEVLAEFIIPYKGMTGSNYLKFGLRRSGSLAVVGVAVAVKMKGAVCEDARIVMGAVAPTPLRAKKAEEMLKGKQVTDELIKEVAAMASTECKPITDHRGSAEYRRHLVGVFTKRALKASIETGHV